MRREYEGRLIILGIVMIAAATIWGWLLVEVVALEIEQIFLQCLRFFL